MWKWVSRLWERDQAKPPGTPVSLAATVHPCPYCKRVVRTRLWRSDTTLYVRLERWAPEDAFDAAPSTGASGR